VVPVVQLFGQVANSSDGRQSPLQQYLIDAGMPVTQIITREVHVLEDGPPETQYTSVSQHACPTGVEVSVLLWSCTQSQEFMTTCVHMCHTFSLEEYRGRGEMKELFDYSMNMFLMYADSSSLDQVLLMNRAVLLLGLCNSPNRLIRD
jgi:hypothetical protein